MINYSLPRRDLEDFTDFLEDVGCNIVRNYHGTRGLFILNREIFGRYDDFNPFEPDCKIVSLDERLEGLIDAYLLVDICWDEEHIEHLKQAVAC